MREEIIEQYFTSMYREGRKTAFQTSVFPSLTLVQKEKLCLTAEYVDKAHFGYCEKSLRFTD